ncbi:unnamed protein product [Brassica napus]|uniref:(rape) hypothetical protein n=1 Tax=Brassica napus TaxID=3708 RepID=A0A816KW65_BRANA|nr:unnamed protein product [Brassica napus]
MVYLGIVLGCLESFSTSWPQVLLLTASVTIRFPQKWGFEKLAYINVKKVRRLDRKYTV